MNFFKRAFVWLICLSLGVLCFVTAAMPYLRYGTAGGYSYINGYGVLVSFWMYGFSGAMSSMLQILVLITGAGALIVGLMGLIREVAADPVAELKKSGCILAFGNAALNLALMILLIVMCAVRQELTEANYVLSAGVFVALTLGIIATVLLLILIKVFGDTSVWAKPVRYATAPVTFVPVTQDYMISEPLRQTVVLQNMPQTQPAGITLAPPPQTVTQTLALGPAPAKKPDKPAEKAKQKQVELTSAVNFRFIEGMSEKQIRNAVEELTQKAARGDADAQFRLGICYANGTGVPQNQTLAAEWQKKAAAQSHAQAKFVLGEYYIAGSGVPKKLVEGIVLIKESAAKGFVGAQMRLGNYYQEGEYLPRDYDKAVQWYTKAAEQGNEFSIAALNRFEQGANGKWKLK